MPDVRRPLLWGLGGALVLVVALAGLGWLVTAQGWWGHSGDGALTDPAGVVIERPTTAAPTPTSSAAGADKKPRRRLAGKVVVLDPGHQLGNHNFLSEIDRPVDAGGFTKPCNSTGTETNAGYPEATFTWNVAQDVRRLLQQDGARVVLTRRSNSASSWGPCVDDRGRVGNPGTGGPAADAKLSIHADGSLSAGAHGFHVIAPRPLPGRTAAIAAPSQALARDVRDAMVHDGFATSSYDGVRGLVQRSDLGTLNWSRRPIVMIECGNMRDPGDAALLTSRQGQQRIAKALSTALERYLLR